MYFIHDNYDKDDIYNLCKDSIKIGFPFSLYYDIPKNKDNYKSNGPDMNIIVLK